MLMFHVTPKEYIGKIIESGFLQAPVYLSPYKITATTYGDSWNEDYSIISIDVDESLFHADMEFCKELSGDLVLQSLENGSVYLKNNLSIANAKIENIEI